MSLDQRLRRLAPALTAQERAILILEAWKEGRPEQPAWRHSMPPDQSKAFNQYIDLMNQANRVLAHLIGILHGQAKMLAMRESWLVTLILWGEQIDGIRHCVGLALREPITESEHAAKLATAREEWVPVADVADFLVGQRDGWREEDFEEAESEWGPAVKEEAWERAAAEEERRLRDLAARGKLPSRGRGKSLKLQEACLEDEFGLTLSAVPDGDLLSYRVMPDDQAEAVEQERHAIETLKSALDWKDYDEEDGSGPVSLRLKIFEGLKETIAQDLISGWIQMRCIDAVLGDIGAAFNDIDPLKPVFRERLEETRTKLQGIREHLLELARMDVVLREPYDEEIEEMREWVASIANP